MLRSVSIKNFRNLNLSELEFFPGFTIIVGENGQGKTNILEAIYFLSYGKSFRDAKDRVIAWRQEEARVFGKTDKANIEITVRRDKENRICINGKSRNLLSLLGRFVSVVFHPQEIDIIFGPPQLRRSWLDRALATTDKNYLHALLNYQKALQNKNKLLKIRVFAEEEMEVWNKSLSIHGAKIWLARERAVADINQILKAQSARLIGKVLFLEYKNPLFGTEGAAAEKLYLKQLSVQRDLERRFLVTFFGPHRDDFKIITEQTIDQNILQKDLASFGSRAEQRQAALLLKFSEAKLFSKFFGEGPTLLLDDITSELDNKNRELLLEHLTAPQVIITTTSLDSLPQSTRFKSRVLVVKNGVATPP